MKNELPKIYLDISCLTNDYLFEYVKLTKAQFCISELTLLELKSYEMYDNSFNIKKIEELLKNITVLKVNDRILRLAKAYTIWDCVSQDQYNDALHIAIAKYYKCFTIIYDKEALNNKDINYSRMKCKRSFA